MTTTSLTINCHVLQGRLIIDRLDRDKSRRSFHLERSFKKQERGIAIVTGMKAKIQKFFGLASDIKLGNRTFTVNNRSRNKFYIRVNDLFEENLTTYSQARSSTRRSFSREGNSALTKLILDYYPAEESNLSGWGPTAASLKQDGSTIKFQVIESDYQQVIKSFDPKRHFLRTDLVLVDRKSVSGRIDKFLHPHSYHLDLAVINLIKEAGRDFKLEKGRPIATGLREAQAEGAIGISNLKKVLEEIAYRRTTVSRRDATWATLALRALKSTTNLQVDLPPSLRYQYDEDDFVPQTNQSLDQIKEFQHHLKVAAATVGITRLNLFILLHKSEKILEEFLSPNSAPKEVNSLTLQQKAFEEVARFREGLPFQCSMDGFQTNMDELMWICYQEITTESTLKQETHRRLTKFIVHYLKNVIVHDLSFHSINGFEGVQLTNQTIGAMFKGGYFEVENLRTVVLRHFRHFKDPRRFTLMKLDVQNFIPKVVKQEKTEPEVKDQRKAKVHFKEKALKKKEVPLEARVEGLPGIFIEEEIALK